MSADLDSLHGCYKRRDAQIPEVDQGCHISAKVGLCAYKMRSHKSGQDCSLACCVECQPSVHGACCYQGLLQHNVMNSAGILSTEVALDLPLAEAGLDSIGSVEFRNAASQFMGTELPATVAFDYPTIAGMAAYIAERTLRAAGSDHVQAPDNTHRIQVLKVQSQATCSLCHD